MDYVIRANKERDAMEKEGKKEDQVETAESSHSAPNVEGPVKIEFNEPSERSDKQD